MNATLQCLSNTWNFTKYFMEIFVQSENKVMANEYHKVIKNYGIEIGTKNHIVKILLKKY